MSTVMPSGPALSAVELPCRPHTQKLGWEGTAYLAAIQTPYPGSKQIACKNSNQNVTQTSKCTDAFSCCNCSHWQLSKFSIKDKPGNALPSKCTSIMGIPCALPALLQLLLQNGMHQDSRSQQEPSFHPAVWVPFPPLYLNWHTFFRRAPRLQSSTSAHTCLAEALKLPISGGYEALCSSLTGRGNAGTGGDGRGTRASHPAPCLL